MTIDTSILYYSASREPEIFEQRIRAQLRESSNNAYPIISVTQKPIDEFDVNVCVGTDVFGEIARVQQIWIGLQYCDTTYVALTESDFVYPPEYFSFLPSQPDLICNYTPVYVLYMWIGHTTKGLYWYKHMSEGARKGTRQAQFDHIESLMLMYRPEIEPREWPIIQKWLTTTPNHPPLMTRSSHIHASDMDAVRKYCHSATYFEGTPAVSMRTKFGMSKVWRPWVKSAHELPYWGHPNDMRTKFGKNVPEFAAYFPQLEQQK